MADFEALGHGGDAVTVTARGLCLGRELRVEDRVEPVYDRTARTFRAPPWDHDSYAGAFGLRPVELSAWARSGARLLDVGAGLATFASEAAVLGLPVDSVDLTFGAGHRAIARARQLVRARYAAEMARLCELARAGAERFALEPDMLALADVLAASGDAVVAGYPSGLGERRTDDARTLATLESDRYDVVVSGWLLVHLDDEGERRAVEAMVRVTRPGGEVRLKAGYGSELAASLARAFRVAHPEGALVVAGKTVALVPGPAADEVLLAVRAR